MASALPMNFSALKVAHFSTYAELGGAGRASYGVHTCLLEAGCDSWMVAVHALSQNERTLQQSKHAQQRVDKLRQMQHALVSPAEPTSDFSPDVSPFTTLDDVELPFVPDIIHLHSVAQFLTAHDIWKLWQKYRAPIVWTLMDMAPFTGGCHYSQGCERFTQQCGACPILHSLERDDISHRSWVSKNQWLQEIPITLVGPSQWSLDLAARSSLFPNARKVRIPHGIDSDIFRFRAQIGVRKLLNLPQKTPIIFFGAANWRDERKGMRYALEALQRLPQVLPQAADLPVALVVGGAELSQTSYLQKLPLKCFSLAQCFSLVSVHNPQMVAFGYQAADVFLCPSTEDFGLMMIPEALLCGTPVVAFDGCSFASDIIQSGTNGYLARKQDSHDLARGIQSVLQSLDLGHITRKTCRDSALPDVAMSVQAARYLHLYDELLH